MPDRVLVAGGSAHTLDILRLATVRSDDVTLVMERLEPAILRFAERFAIDVRERTIAETDLEQANTVLISIGDVGQENRVIRKARRCGVPIHVANRPLVSDVTMLQFLKGAGGTDIRA